MREIKFRAWNDIDKMLIDWGVLRASPVFFMNIIKGKARHHKLMQFTGLTDVNGVEIYEGDIVSDHVGIGQVKYSDKHGAFRVCYGDGMAKWFIDYFLKGERESIKVIGNIHENPELLEN